jgi:hypothetical protein
MHETNWGECYYDHYTRHFREPVSREIFSQNETSPTIQILAYTKVFPDCKVFGSLGLTHYPTAIESLSEAIVVTDEGWQEIPYLLANTLFYIVQKPMRFGPGIVISGVDILQPRFAQTYQKTALYFTTTDTVETLPENFGRVGCSNETGVIYIGYFISTSERAFWKQHGSEHFETLLAEKRADLFHLRRSACV